MPKLSLITGLCLTAALAWPSAAVAQEEVVRLGREPLPDGATAEQAQQQQQGNDGHSRHARSLARGTVGGSTPRAGSSAPAEPSFVTARHAERSGTGAANCVISLHLLRVP